MPRARHVGLPVFLSNSKSSPTSTIVESTIATADVADCWIVSFSGI